MLQMWADKAALKLQRRAHIMWENEGPKTVLIVKKPGSAKASAKLQEIARWCACAPGLLSLIMQQSSSRLAPSPCHALP